METTLHRQLKEHYCSEGCEIEVKFGRYRIDVVDGDRLIEIQHSGLASIRSKIQNLTQSHKVDVVKPIVARKRLVKLSRKGGKVVSERMSPKRGGFLDLIDELMYFTRVFPHTNLRMIVPKVEVTEFRYPGHGRRRRKRAGDFVVQDRVMERLIESTIYVKAQDLHQELPPTLAETFDTQELAAKMEIARWQAQRVAYVLKHTGSIKQVGKQGNSLLYKKVRPRRVKKKSKSVRGKATAA